MRGEDRTSGALFCYVDVEARIGAKPTSPTSSTSSSIPGPHRASTNSCHGHGPKLTPPIDSRPDALAQSQPPNAVGREDRLLLDKDAPNLSPSAIGRLKSGWEDDYRRWPASDLSARRYVYVWADGVYLQARMEPQAECILVLIGATPEGKEELLGLQTGMRESGQSWRNCLSI
jgi:hypothetical protein